MMSLRTNTLCRPADGWHLHLWKRMVYAESL